MADIFHHVRLRYDDDGIHNDVKCLARRVAWLCWSPRVLTPARSLHCSDRTSPMKAYPSITLAIKPGQGQAYKYPLLTPHTMKRQNYFTEEQSAGMFRWIYIFYSSQVSVVEVFMNLVEIKWMNIIKDNIIRLAFLLPTHL